MASTIRALFGLANGNPVFVQTDAAGNAYAPWRLDIKDTKITWMGSLPHTRHSQIDAWNEGLHDGWLDAKRSHDHQYAAVPMTMGYYTREDLPFYYALADAFTVCDQSYCGAMTSTTPNRSLFWTGTVRDRQSPDSNVFLRNGQYRPGEMTWKTFPERLEEAGIHWKIYQNELSLVGGMSKEQHAWLSNFEDNPLEYFKAYSLEANPRSIAYLQQKLAETTETVQKQESKLAVATDAATAASLHADLELDRRSMATLTAMLAQSSEKRYEQLTEQQRRLHDLAFATNTADPDWMKLDPLEYAQAGHRQTIACTERRHPAWLSQRCGRGSIANSFMACATGEILRSSNVTVVRRLVRIRSAQHPHAKPRRVEEDDLHPHV